MDYDCDREPNTILDNYHLHPWQAFESAPQLVQLTSLLYYHSYSYR